MVKSTALRGVIALFAVVIGAGLAGCSSCDPCANPCDTPNPCATECNPCDTPNP